MKLRETLISNFFVEYIIKTSQEEHALVAIYSNGWSDRKLLTLPQTCGPNPDVERLKHSAIFLTGAFHLTRRVTGTGISRTILHRNCT